MELLLSSDAVISEAGVRPSGDWIVHSDADALIEDNNGRLGGSVVVQP